MFQSMMDATFKDLIDEGIIIIYMDDLFLFAKDLTLLEENTKRVLQWLLDIKPRKCEFARTKVEWLGMIIEEN